MATSIFEKRLLKLEKDNGVVDGKQRLSTQSFSDIKADATDENLYAVSTAIDALSSKEVLNVKKVDSHIINA